MPPPPDAAAFGRGVRNARRRAGLTQQQLAARTGLDRATISLIENGHEQPRADTMFRLAEVLAVNPADLWRLGQEGTPDGAAEPSRERETGGPGARYEPLAEPHLHPGLEELLSDDTTRLMLGLSAEEERMLRSIRTRSEVPLSKEFFLDVLVAYRRHRREADG